MDWTKAKTILIVALLLANAFLIFTCASANKSEQIAINEEELIVLLENKNIFIETEIPHEALTIMHTEFSKEEIEALIASVDPISDGKSQDDYLQAVEEFFGYLGFPSEYVEFTYMEKNKDITTLFFKTRVNGIDVDVSDIKCVFEGNKIKEIDGNIFWPKEFLKKKIDTSSAVEALLSFFSEWSGDEGAIISKIELVYWIGDEYNENIDYLSVTALPAWKITYDEGKKIYIDAF